MLGLGSPEVGPPRGDDLTLTELLGDFAGAGNGAVPAAWASTAAPRGDAAATPAPALFGEFEFKGAGGAGAAASGGGGAARNALEDSPWSPDASLVRLPRAPRCVFLEDDCDDAPPLPRVPAGLPVAAPASALNKERLGALRPANAPGGGLPRLPPTQAPSHFYGAAARGGDAGGASSSAAAALRVGNPALAALLQKKGAGEPAARPLRRDRSDASLPASDAAARKGPAKKRRVAVIDSSDDSEEEDEAVTDSDDDAPARKGRGAPKAGGSGEADEGADGEADADAEAEAAAELASEEEEEEGGSDSGASSGDEEELYGDTLEECGRIAAGLRSALGAASSGDRVAATDAGGAEALRLVSAAEVRAACVDGAPAAKAAACPELKGYQLVGVNFLLLLHTQGVEGAILADEMGLGKTAQAISFMAAVNARRMSEGHPPQPHLVIAPASVLENWARELDRWAPALKCVAYHGTGRHQLRRSIEDEMERAHAAGDDDPSPPFDVLLCCYTMFERDTADQQDDRKFVRGFRFGYAVLDEAHLVKNRAAQRARRLRHVLGRAAAHRLMLTGTPLQNDLGELLALLELLMPSLFDGRGALLDEAELKRAGRGGDASARTIARVRHLLGPFVLRRLKREVLQQLTPKVQVTQAIAATSAQQALYAAALTAVRAEVAAKAAAKAAGAGVDVERVVGAARLKALFTYLRKVANHPLLVRQRYTDADVAEVSRLCALRGVFGADAPPKKVKEHVESLSDFALHALCADPRLGGALLHRRLPSDAALDSGKARFLAELLPALKAQGSRPLIFSQWKIMLDVLEWVMAELKLTYFRLDGSTPVEERQALVDAYNAPGSTTFAFLLSTRAGGQGINLTGADTVILHDCDFNPQIDRQAEDRSHRLGQTRPVTVYRLVTQETVDAKIVAIAERKLSLDAAVLSAEDDTAPEEGAGDAKASRAAEARSMAALLQGLLAESGAGTQSDSAAGGASAPAVIIRDTKDD